MKNLSSNTTAFLTAMLFIVVSAEVVAAPTTKKIIIRGLTESGYVLEARGLYESTSKSLVMGCAGLSFEISGPKRVPNLKDVSYKAVVNDGRYELSMNIGKSLGGVCGYKLLGLYLEVKNGNEFKSGYSINLNAEVNSADKTDLADIKGIYCSAEQVGSLIQCALNANKSLSVGASLSFADLQRGQKNIEYLIDLKQF